MADDMRFYETFYAMHVDDLKINFGTFSNHHKVLQKGYINLGCSTTDSTDANIVSEFIYPHHIKKTYFIEGVISGQITIAAQSDEATITSFRVTVCKMNIDNSQKELFTTGWIEVNDTLSWDAVHNIGDEMVYPFWIDAWEKEELGEEDKIFLRVEVNCNAYAVLWHSNNKRWEDIKIEIPFKL